MKYTHPAILFNWNRFTEYASKQGFRIPNYGSQLNYIVSQNELDVVYELVDRLVEDAKHYGSGTVTGSPCFWGSCTGGIRFRFSDPSQAILWKLAWM